MSAAGFGLSAHHCRHKDNTWSVNNFKVIQNIFRYFVKYHTTNATLKQLAEEKPD